MSHWWLPACLVLVGSVARAQEDDSVSAVQKDLRKTFQTVNQEKREIKEEEILALIDRCLAIYDKSSGEPEEFEALRAILQLSSYVDTPKVGEAWLDAINQLAADFTDDDRWAELVVSCPAPRKLTGDRDKLLAKVEGATKSDTVKAAFSYRKLQPELSKLDDDQLDDAGRKALATKLEALAKQFPAALVPYEGVTYPEWVKSKVYAMEHLKIGAVAPEITAPDLDGVAFKLSDYRGKVVLLDFWGYW